MKIYIKKIIDFLGITPYKWYVSKKIFYKLGILRKRVIVQYSIEDYFISIYVKNPLVEHNIGESVNFENYEYLNIDGTKKNIEVYLSEIDEIFIVKYINTSICDEGVDRFIVLEKLNLYK